MTALSSPARDLSERLSVHALSVCRTYLSNGRRNGRYWSVGDVYNSRGSSLYVRTRAANERLAPAPPRNGRGSPAASRQPT